AHRTYFRHFESSVDGKQVRARRVIGQRPTEDTDDYYEAWWIKSVRSAKGQTHIITDRYQGDGWYSSYGCLGFQYTMKTGASWKGKIGKALIVCDLGAVA